MKRQLVAVAVLLSLCVTTLASGMQSPTVFRKLDFFIHAGDEADDRDAQLVLDPNRRVLLFAEEDNVSRVFATVDWDRITGVTYENSKHARITAGLLIAWPMLFLKGKKHWLTVTYGPGAAGETGGYVYARMDKSNFQAILAAISGFTGYEIRRVEENGEISILYPGARTTYAAEPAAATSPPNTSATPAASAAPTASATPPRAEPVRTPFSGTPQTTTASQPVESRPAEAVPAAPLPAAPLPAASGDHIAAGPLPPAAEAIRAPSLVNKGVQWTERSGGVVGYLWGAEVENSNSAAIGAVVVLCLRDASGAVIHEAREVVQIPPGEVSGFTATGSLQEDVAVRAANWTFDVAAAEPGDGEEGGADAAVAARSGVADSARARPVEEAVSLTASMIPPQLIFESAQIDIQDPELQSLKLSGKRISVSCLVQTDGTVGAARVQSVNPPLSLRAAADTLARSVERSAIMYWRFTPATDARVPKPVWYTVSVRYEPAG